MNSFQTIIDTRIGSVMVSPGVYDSHPKLRTAKGEVSVSVGSADAGIHPPAHGLSPPILHGRVSHQPTRCAAGQPAPAHCQVAPDHHHAAASLPPPARGSNGPS